MTDSPPSAALVPKGIAVIDGGGDPIARLIGDVLRGIAIRALINEVDREVKQRRRSFPKSVRAGALPQGLADERLAMMEIVLAILKRLDHLELAL